MEEIIRRSIQNIQSAPGFSSNTLYLLFPINNSSAFFLQNNTVIFGQTSTGDNNVSKTDTIFLSMYLGVTLSAISNNTTYAEGPYNLIRFNNSADDYNFPSFLDLCIVYSSNKDLRFCDFFYSMINLFQLPSMAKELNLIGLIGELGLIYEIWKQYNINISKIWHQEGSKSRYDFSCTRFSIEVKSTVRDSSTFSIKHNQIFGPNTCYIAVLNLKEGYGNTLQDYLDYFKNTAPFSTDLIFQIKLHEEKLRVDRHKALKSRYSTEKISIFDKNQMESITNIPECISELSYNYTFDYRKSLDLHSFSKLLNE